MSTRRSNEKFKTQTKAIGTTMLFRKRRNTPQLHLQYSSEINATFNDVRKIRYVDGAQDFLIHGYTGHVAMIYDNRKTFLLACVGGVLFITRFNSSSLFEQLYRYGTTVTPQFYVATNVKLHNRNIMRYCADYIYCDDFLSRYYHILASHLFIQRTL